MPVPAALVDVRRQWMIAAREAKTARTPQKRKTALRRCDILLDRWLREHPR